MANRTNSPTAKRPAAKRLPQPLAIIVRRGALRRFEALTRKTTELPVMILWDRRVKTRRGAAQATDQDRRKSDRRRKPPFTWDLADFVVVEPLVRKGARCRTGKD